MAAVTDLVRRAARPSGASAAALMMGWLSVVLWLDRAGGGGGVWLQRGLGLLTWAVLVAALVRVTPLVRAQTAVVVAANGLGRTLARSIQNDPLSPTRIMAFFDDRTPERLGEVLEAPVAGGFDSVASFVRANRVPIDLVKENAVRDKAAARSNLIHAVSRIHAGFDEQRFFAAFLIIVPNHNGIGGFAGAHCTIAEVKFCHIASKVE